MSAGSGSQRALSELREMLARFPLEGVDPARRQRRTLRRGLLRAVLLVLMLAGLLALPFVAFVRLSVDAYARAGWGTWPAVVAGGLAAAGVITVYAAFVSKKLTGRSRALWLAKWVAVPLVMGYAGYGLWYLSSMNAKTEEIRSHYTSLHPLLRVALGTIVLVDRQVVVTDVQRTPDGYARMGLPRNDRSLHYEQRDGFVHAVDLRTLGRSALQNRLTELYFRAMGFRTLRHVGTADHLHVTLPGSRERALGSGGADR